MKYKFTGLNSKEVEESRSKHGSNELAVHEIEGFWDKLKDNFKDPIIIILCAALVVILILSFFHLAEWYEAVGIGTAVIMATFVSTFSEYKNESSFQKLQEEASRIKSNVFRNGSILEIFVNDIVADDYVLLQAGDKIPADGKIIEGELKVNQASLTGESESVHKSKVIENYKPKENDFSDPHIVFRGSVVDDGEAVLLVETVGDNSFYGKLSKELGSSEDRPSPLQVKLTKLAQDISKFGYVGATLIFISFLFKKMVINNDFSGEKIAIYFSNWSVVLQDVLNALVLSIIIVVAAIPEGLPMMIAIVLSLNMRKLLSAKVLVRKLLGIETSGSLNILFSDKTGTITKGQLEPKAFISGDRKSYDSFKVVPEKLREILSFSIMENSACVISESLEIMGGNISERALLAFIDKDTLKKQSPNELVKSILFNSSRKFSASQVKGKVIPGEKGDEITLIKGASEIILAGCKYYYDDEGNKKELLDREGFLKNIDDLADSGIRLIALSTSEEKIKEDESLAEIRTLVGVIAIRDEIREESKHSILEAQKAGIQVVMITGDRKGTAISIAKEIGLLKNEDDLTLTSDELNKHSDEELKKILPKLRVVSRALPTDKSRLVKIAKSIGKVVGMTGDGVNDSAALKQSDVGFAMGSGSEVSKEAGDIVILDDNFKSITSSILYGRTIFKSIRKFIVFQLTVNVAAVLTTFIGPFIGIDFPLTIIQILWINIIMDTLAALALGGEPALERYMDELPIDREENILTKDMISAILVNGLFITGFSIFFLKYQPIKDLFIRDGQADNAVFLTAFFALFVFLVVFNSFNARTEKINLFEHITENKGFFVVIGGIFSMQIVFSYFGGKILRTVALTPQEWLMIIGMAITIIPLDLIRKAIRNSLQKS